MLVCAVSLLGVGGLEMMATSPVDAPGAKPRIAIVATGGTIAGAAESTHGGWLQVRQGVGGRLDQRRAADEEVRGVQVSPVGSRT